MGDRALGLQRVADLPERHGAGLGQLLVTSIQLMTHYANEYYDYDVDAAVGPARTPFSGGSGVLVGGQVISEQVGLTLDKVTPSHCILASNTSSISMTLLAAATKRPAKVVGMATAGGAAVCA